MRTEISKNLEAARILIGDWGSDPNSGPVGAFLVWGPCTEKLKIIASDGRDPLSDGWEHVSVSTRRRCPNWIEMSFVKDLFWNDEECVVQFHPPKSDYVNNHRYALHLWRHKTQEFPRPPSIMVGVKDMGEFKTKADLLKAKAIAEAAFKDAT